MPKCFYCDKEGIKQKRIIVDVDVCHDVDDEGHSIFTNQPLYSNEWLCADHIESEDINENTN